MAGNHIFTVETNEDIARNVFRMRLSGPTGDFKAPGQFVDIRLEGLYLRRPISVCDWGDGWIDIIYKVVGQGTAQLAMLGGGSELDILTGLGNGFSAEEARGKEVVLVGGGVGLPPLYALAKQLHSQIATPKVVLGFASAADVFFEEEFEQIGCGVLVCTEDGSAGAKGRVTDVLADLQYDYYCASGPMAMLAAVHAAGERRGAAGQLTFEERMGCGFGVCMGCTIQTKTGPRRVCKDGPVFRSTEVAFDG